MVFSVVVIGSLLEGEEVRFLPHLNLEYIKLSALYIVHCIISHYSKVLNSILDPVLLGEFMFAIFRAY